MVVGLAAPAADRRQVVSLRLRWFFISKSEDAVVRDNFPSKTIELDIDLVPAPVGRSRARWPVSRAAVEPR